MYIPDRVFYNRLKALDRKLSCHFNREKEVVVVTYERATGEPVPIYTVTDDSGGFRVPDQRDIIKIQQGDLTRESLESRLGKTARYMEGFRAKQRRTVHEEFMAATADNKNQLAKAFSGDSKRQHVRSIQPKPKGKVFS